MSPAIPKLPRASRRRVLRATGAALFALPALASRAQALLAGGKPVTLVVSYPAGGGADLMARLIAPSLSQALGTPVVVENKPGASGQLAAQQVARAAPDGSQLLLDASSFAVNPSLFPKLPYDSDKAFAPIGVLALFPNVLVCTPSFAARSVRDLVRMAKAEPGKLAYASSGNGSAQHLAGALFEDRAGVKLTHVPYRGGGPALNDVMGGQVPLFFANVASSLGHIQAGKLRALAVTSRRRARALPEVPSMEEAGVAGYEVFEWNPLLAPAGVDAATRARLRAALVKVLGEPEVLGRIRALSGDPFEGNASEAAVAAFLKAQQAQWQRVIRQQGIVAG
jgi:tripartite-type tricarboxylate transporter receptor subunit TctC